MTSNNLGKKEFILPYGSRVVRVHHGGEAWQRAAGAMAGSQEITFSTTKMKQRN